MNKIYLVEDHDEVLKIWRRAKIKGLDLLHLDAHIDFRFFEAQSLEDILGQARSVNDLKQRLERSISFKNYEKDFNKQTNIGNFVYLAMKEGIARHFTWVVPGSIDDFQKSRNTIKKVLKDTFQQKDQSIVAQRKGCLTTTCLGRDVRVCCLETLPCFKAPVLLDIDTDFLVMKSIHEDDPTKNIARRKPWISASDLVKALQEKAVSAPLVTISYSVNGGWTPMKYKYLGDELAYQFSRPKFKKRFIRRLKAAHYFNRFAETGDKGCYQKAVRIHPDYRATDNNYGQLYLARHRYARAKKEFNKVLRADTRNPGALWGLGCVTLDKREFLKSKRYFLKALYCARRSRPFNDIKKRLLFNLGQTEFGLKNFKRSEALLLSYRAKNRFDCHASYLLGRIAQKNKKFSRAALFYKQAIQLGFDTAQGLLLLLKIARRVDKNSDIISFIEGKSRLIKKGLPKLKSALRPKDRLRLKKSVRLLDKRIGELKKEEVHG